MEERKQRNACEFQRQAAQCFHMGGMFTKAQEKADQRKETEVQVIIGQENGLKKSDLDNPAQPALTRILMIRHRFSMGLRSRDWAAQSMRINTTRRQYAVIVLDI